MRVALLLLLAAALFSWVAQGVPLPATVSDSLLASAREAHWAGNSDRAVPVFRAYLEVHPGDRSVRRDLANALAWSGHASRAIPLYDELLLEDPGDPSLLKARADALRWLDRNEEAMAAYRTILEVDPSDAEASKWIDELRGRVDPERLGEGEYFHDSSGITTARWATAYRVAGSVLHNLALSGGIESIEGSEAKAIGSWLAAGWRRVLPGGHLLSGEAGAILYDDGPGVPRFDASIQTRPAAGLSAGLAVGYRDRAYELKSFRAHVERIEGYHGAVSSYWLFARDGGLWAQVRGGWLNDGNTWRTADLSLDHGLPAGLRVSANAYGIDYAQNDAVYYAPAEEWSYSARLSERLQLSRHASVELSGWFGEIGNRSGRGHLSGARLGFSLRVVPTLEIRGTGEYSSSRRASTYIWRELALAVRWSR